MSNSETFKGNQGNEAEIKSAEKVMSPEQAEMSRIREWLMTKNGMDKVNEALTGKRGYAVTMEEKAGRGTILDLGRLLRVRLLDPKTNNMIADFEKMSVGYSSIFGYAIAKDERESKDEPGSSGWTMGDMLEQLQIEGVPFGKAMHDAIQPEITPTTEPPLEGFRGNSPLEK